MVPRLLVFSLAAALALAWAPAGASSAPRKSPHLSYKRAKRSIQQRADRFAGSQTKITSMYRLRDTLYSGRAEWERINPTGCAGCGFDPITGNVYDEPRTESCSVSLEARLLRSGRVRVSTESFACY